MSGFIWTFPGGKLLDNMVVKGTAAGAGKGDFSESETEHRITVPANKRWLLFSIPSYRDASATILVQAFNSSDQIIGEFGYHAATTGVTVWPNMTAQVQNGIYVPFPMKAGDYIKITFGANQAATAYVGAVVLEVDA